MGLGAGVVAALVGDDDAKASGSEWVDLLMPGIPKLGKAVKKDDDRTGGWTSGNSVKFDVTVVKS